MKYDYIIVLCPWKKINGKFPEFFNGLYLGGQTRMDAAVEVYKMHQNAKFILVGGYNEDDGVTNFYRGSQKTTDMQMYMLERGVKPDNITIINSLPCTRHNLIAILNAYKDTLNGKNIGLLTNFFHMPRALRFWGELTRTEEFKHTGIFLEPLIAESFVGRDESRLRNCEYIAALESEIRGLINIEENTYEDRCWKKYNDFFRILQEKDNINILLTAEEKINFYRK